MIDQITKHLQAICDGNWTEARALLTDDAVYEELASQQRVDGADQLVAAFQRWRKAFPDMRVNILDSVTGGSDRAVVEVEWTGTHTGALDSPMGTISATNHQARIRAILSFRFVDGKIAESRHYFDMLTLMQQLGLAPATGAQAPAQKPQQAPKRS